VRGFGWKITCQVSKGNDNHTLEETKVSALIWAESFAIQLIGLSKSAHAASRSYKETTG
jgi:hypothetical protein